MTLFLVAFLTFMYRLVILITVKTSFMTTVRSEQAMAHSFTRVAFLSLHLLMFIFKFYLLILKLASKIIYIINLKYFLSNNTIINTCINTSISNQKSFTTSLTYQELPAAKGILSSQLFILQSLRGIFPRVTVLPPAFSIKNPTLATSYRTLNLLLCFYEAQLTNIPWPLIKIWQTSGTIPPVYRSVNPLIIQLFTASLYSLNSDADLKFPGLKILVFPFIVQCQCESTHFLLIRVSYCTLSTQGL